MLQVAMHPVVQLRGPATLSSVLQPKHVLQGCAKKLVPGWEKSTAQLQTATAGHARLVLSKTVTFSHNPVRTPTDMHRSCNSLSNTMLL